MLHSDRSLSHSWTESRDQYLTWSDCRSWRISVFSSHMSVLNHNWSARKQHLHPQSAARTSRHSALSEDRIRQCGTSSESCCKDTDQCLQVAISYWRHCSVPVLCKNGSVETTVSEGGQNPVAGLWGHTLGRNWLPEPTSSYASIDFWCQLLASPATAASWMSVVEFHSAWLYGE